MTVLFGAAGTGASGTTTASPAYPAGISADTSHLYFIAHSGDADDEQPALTDPSSEWTLLRSFSGGSGAAYGVDVGDRRITIWKKNTVTGAETGTVTVTIAGGAAATVLHGRIVRIESASGLTLQEQFSDAEETTHDTTSQFSSGSLIWNTGDLLAVFYSSCVDAISHQGVLMTPSTADVTLGATSGRYAQAVTNGNDLRAGMLSWDVTATASADVNATAQWDGTSSGNQSGSFIYMLLHETSAAAGDITGSLAATETADAASIDADVVITGALSVTEAADSLSSAADVIVSGSLTVTEARDIAQISAAAEITATLAAVEAGDVIAIDAGVVVTGSFAVVEASDAASVAADVIVTAALGAVESADRVAINASSSNVANLSAQEPRDVASVDADILISVEIASSEAADAASISANVLIAGALSGIEAADQAAVLVSTSSQVSMSAQEQRDVLSVVAEIAVSVRLQSIERADSVAIAGTLERTDFAPTPTRRRVVYATQEALRFGRAAIPPLHIPGIGTRPGLPSNIVKQLVETQHGEIEVEYVKPITDE